jgi:hypothetical protein
MSGYVLGEHRIHITEGVPDTTHDYDDFGLQNPVTGQVYRGRHRISQTVEWEWPPPNSLLMRRGHGNDQPHPVRAGPISAESVGSIMPDSVADELSALVVLLDSFPFLAVAGFAKQLDITSGIASAFGDRDNVIEF